MAGSGRSDPGFCGRSAICVADEALPELRPRRAEDHRGHPGAAGDREDPHPPEAGSAAAAQRPSARGGASLRDLSRAGRHNLHDPGCNARPQPGRRRATLRRDTIGIRVNPEGMTGCAPRERPKDLPTPLDATTPAPNPGTSGRRRCRNSLQARRNEKPTH